MTGVDPTNPPEENVGPAVVAQVDGIDVTPHYWTEDPWEDDRSIELMIRADDPGQPLGWCEGAGVIADPCSDSITAMVVLPEGSISMTISRAQTGRLILTTPDHEDGTLPVYRLGPGTYQVRDAVRTEDI